MQYSRVLDRPSIPLSDTPSPAGAVSPGRAMPELPCQDPDAGDLWFAERSSDVEEAKRLCGYCPIKSECFSGARRRGEPWGVWGGEIFIDGVVAARKRGRGRPRKSDSAGAATSPAGVSGSRGAA